MRRIPRETPEVQASIPRVSIRLSADAGRRIFFAVLARRSYKAIGEPLGRASGSPILSRFIRRQTA